MHTSACKGEHVMVVYFYISAFYNALSSEVLNVPQLSACPGSDTPVPYVLVADDAFPLTSYLIKPYAVELPKESPKRVFNYRLSRARRIVENAFRLLASAFRIFRKPLIVKPSTAEDITLACEETAPPNNCIVHQEHLILKTLTLAR